MILRNILLQDKIVLFHPETSKYGRLIIHKPHSDSSHLHWSCKNKVATITPNSKLPIILKQYKMDVIDNIIEPEIQQKTNAAGAVVEEEDGRIWIIHPTNEYLNIRATFPKGRIEKERVLDTVLLQETAIRETFEETGLNIILHDFICDIITKKNHVIRYYHAKRISGHPRYMGWESQAVSLVPKEQLKSILHTVNDHKVVDVLLSKKIREIS